MEVDLMGQKGLEGLEIGRCGPVFWCVDLPKPKSTANVCLYLRTTCFKMILGSVEKSHQNPAPVHIWWMFHKLLWFNHPPLIGRIHEHEAYLLPLFYPFLRLVDSKSETVDLVFYGVEEVIFHSTSRKLRFESMISPRKLVE